MNTQEHRSHTDTCTQIQRNTRTHIQVNTHIHVNTHMNTEEHTHRHTHTHSSDKEPAGDLVLGRAHLLAREKPYFTFCCWPLLFACLRGSQTVSVSPGLWAGHACVECCPSFSVLFCTYSALREKLVPDGHTCSKFHRQCFVPCCRHFVHVVLNF